MSTYLKTWSDYGRKDGSPLSDSDKAYFRARTRRHVHGVVLQKFSEISEDDRSSRSKLAKRLGVDRSQVTRWLGSPGNWTLDTLSDLLLAMSCQVSLTAEEIAQQSAGNYVHPASTIASESHVPDPFASTTESDVHRGIEVKISRGQRAGEYSQTEAA